VLQQKERSRVLVLGMGGTIAGRAQRADDNVGYEAGQVPVQELLGGLAVQQDLVLSVEQVAQINSKDMRVADLQRLVARVAAALQSPEVDAVVVTHGTDTLEETAYLLQTLLEPHKPVVLTCAMRPATAMSPDGPQNLSDAFAVARTNGARGVVVVCAGRVHSALDVAKVHPYRLDPFDSGDAGPIAVVEEGVLRRFRPWPCVAWHRELAELFVSSAELPRVAWLSSHAGAEAWPVEALLALPAARRPAGIVVSGTGNGSVHEDLLQALQAAQAAGVRVALAARCGAAVVPHPAQAFVALDGLSPVKARWALVLDLLAG
jgi:L-asparaginase